MLKNKVGYWKHEIGRRMFSKRIEHLSSNKIYVSFTFDTEEDWDNNNPLYYNSMVYYGSYKYITSDAFYQLVDGLNERDISATFYVTYNVARDVPEILRYLEEKNQAIGVHVHPHNFQKVKYPYDTGENGDKITSYSFTRKIEWMKLVNDQIESVAGHEILLYRSGQLACDNETEKAAKLTGFKAISNHSGIYYMKPFNTWNLGAGRCDIFDFKVFDSLNKYIELFKSEPDPINVFSAHPMLLYNHATDEIREKELNIFFEFVDYLNSNKEVEIIDQYQLLQMVEEWRGAK
jgi:peptidoglycan/xylan/chitin deacetylase (PgdA/CDA1 family)